MSQSGPTKVASNVLPPDVATSYIGNVGVAVPSGNVLNVLGSTNISVTGSGDTLTISYTGSSAGVSSVTGTSPITASPTTGAVVVSIDNATTTTVGAASFNATNFSVLAGAVSSQNFTITAGSGLSGGGTLTLGGSITLSAGASIATTYTGNSGSATAAANNLNVLGTGSITISGSGSTLTTSLTGLTNHALQVGAGTATLTQLSVGSTGQVLQANSAADPTWSTATYPSTATGTGTILRADGTNWVATTSTYPNTNAINTLLYASSANVMSALATSNNGVLITSSGGVPSWLAAGTTGQVLIATTGSPASWGSPPASSVTFTGDSGTPFSGAAVTITGGTTGLTFAAATPNLTLGGTLKLANGGTNASLAASNGGIFYSTATAGAILSGTATAKQVLLSGASTTPAWSTATYPATTSINQVLYSSSANVIGGITAANNGVLISGTSGIPSWLAAGTTGQVLTATTGSPPSWASPATSGTVTSVSVVTANGFAGSVATATTTPAITLTTSQTGLLSGNGTAITGTAITQYNVITGGASNAPNSVAPTATSGIPLISQGSSSQPIFGTAVVSGGGTGVTTMTTAYAPVCAGTTATGALQVASTGLSTSGYVLTSNGSSALPSFQNIVTSGTFTPTLFGLATAGVTTYTAQVGYYYKYI